MTPAEQARADANWMRWQVQQEDAAHERLQRLMAPFYEYVERLAVELIERSRLPPDAVGR